MTLTLEIERLVLDGIAATPAQAERIRAAAAAELERLFGTGPLPERLRAGFAVPSLSAPAMELVPGATPEAIGMRIARSVHGSLDGTISGRVPAPRSLAARGGQMPHGSS